jgi:sulfite exporter TauE/SafE
LALLLFDFPLPHALPEGAERLVGVIMIAAGGSLALALLRSRHQERQPTSLREKAPFLIGMVHGTAGSAAVFALLPMTLLSPLMGVVYVLVFSFGVLVGMMGFGFGFDRLTNAVGQYARALDRPLRGVVSVMAIIFGSYWLMGA